MSNSYVKGTCIESLSIIVILFISTFQYGILACNGIFFNHESPLRGETFVTRKITIGLCKIKLGIEKKLILGNLNSKRDWGHAKDFVMAQWLIMQQKKPGDYVIATGQHYTVNNFINLVA